MLHRSLIPQEVALQGLLGKQEAPPVDIRRIPGKGRGVFATSLIKKGEFICEYKTCKVYPRSSREKEEEEYVINEEPCMVLDVLTAKGWFTLDATRRFNTLG